MFGGIAEKLYKTPPLQFLTPKHPPDFCNILSIFLYLISKSKVEAKILLVINNSGFYFHPIFILN